ncbi:MAG: hypothetical protein KDD49_09930, partial [Bacteroidetes bacterium]|nr:hypothetical protein [Bacteroidota bacterium]
MNVRCESCGVQLKVNPEKLKGLYNKKIKFPCKNCGNDIKIHVTADFLNQKKVPEKKFHTDVI